MNATPVIKDCFNIVWHQLFRPFFIDRITTTKINDFIK